MFISFKKNLKVKIGLPKNYNTYEDITIPLNY